MDALIRNAKAGDTVALEKLLGQIAPSIQRFGLRMCKNQHDSEDILQDTLLTVLDHLDEFEGRSSFLSWVFTLTRTACNRKRRGLKNAPALPIENAGEQQAAGPSPEESTLHREWSGQLVFALDALSDEHREVILLRDVEDLTALEAAETLGITVEALKSRLHRARQALRSALKPVLEPAAPLASPACPDIMDLWSRKLDGELNALDCAEMERHVASCPACASACNALKTALVACRREKSLEIRPEIQEQVRSAVRRWISLRP